MTFAIGWKYKSSVYLVADSALSGASPMATITTFNEKHELGPNTVQEATLKLAVIGPGTAMTYAGSTQIASRVITFMKRNFDPDISPEMAFDRARCSVGPFSNDPRQLTSFLLARSYPTGSASLTHWNTLLRQSEDVESFRALGSLPVNSAEREGAEAIVKKFEKEGAEETSFLPRVTSAFQSFGQNNAELLKYGVGGIFWGLRTTQGVVHWQPRTLYLIDPSPGAPRPTYVLAFTKDDVLVVLSGYTQTHRAFPFPFDTGKPVSEMCKEAAKEFTFPPDWNDWLCLVNLIAGSRRVIVITRDSTKRKSRHITFEPQARIQLYNGDFYNARNMKAPDNKMLMTHIRE